MIPVCVEWDGELLENCLPWFLQFFNCISFLQGLFLSQIAPKKAEAVDRQSSTIVALRFSRCTSWCLYSAPWPAGRSSLAATKSLGVSEQVSGSDVWLFILLRDVLDFTPQKSKKSPSQKETWLPNTICEGPTMSNYYWWGRMNGCAAPTKDKISKSCSLLVRSFKPNLYYEKRSPNYHLVSHASSFHVSSCFRSASTLANASRRSEVSAARHTCSAKNWRSMGSLHAALSGGKRLDQAKLR